MRCHPFRSCLENSATSFGEASSPDICALKRRPQKWKLYDLIHVPTPMACLREKSPYTDEVAE